MARRPWSREEAESKLQSGLGPQMVEALQRLPDDVSPALAADAVLSLVRSSAYHSTWLFARKGRKLPAPVVRAVLQRLPTLDPKPAWAVFLLEAMAADADAALLGAWNTALDALLDLQTTYAWGSQQRKAKLRALAASPRFLPAIQAAVAGGKDPMLDMLAVLMADGSEASLDGLLPHFAAAHADRSHLLDQLERLETHAAKTPAVTSLLESVKARLQERNDASPALEFARRIGFDVATFKVRAWFGSVELNEGKVPRYQASIDLDSTSPTWLNVHVSRVERLGAGAGTSFSNAQTRRDTLGLGVCTVDELPGWLARAQAKLAMRWRADAKPRGSLRGKKRAQFIEWLFGPSAAAPR